MFRASVMLVVRQMLAEFPESESFHFAAFLVSVFFSEISSSRRNNSSSTSSSSHQGSSSNNNSSRNRKAIPELFGHGSTFAFVCEKDCVCAIHDKTHHELNQHEHEGNGNSASNNNNNNSNDAKPALTGGDVEHKPLQNPSCPLQDIEHHYSHPHQQRLQEERDWITLAYECWLPRSLPKHYVEHATSDDVNAKDSFGFTPLHYAAMEDNFLIAGILVQHKVRSTTPFGVKLSCSCARAKVFSFEITHVYVMLFLHIHDMYMT